MSEEMFTLKSAFVFLLNILVIVISYCVEVVHYNILKGKGKWINHLRLIIVICIKYVYITTKVTWSNPGDFSGNLGTAFTVCANAPLVLYLTPTPQVGIPTLTL